MHRNKSQLLLLSNRTPTNTAYYSVATTRWKVMIPLSVAVSVYQKKKQRLLKRKWTGNKKGKEKAHNTIDGGRGDSDSDNEDSHHVKFEQCLMTSTANFSDYSLCDGNSLTSPNNPKARAYSARTAASSPTIIIDSGTTSHIHSNCRDFTSLNSSLSMDSEKEAGQLKVAVKPNCLPSCLPVAVPILSYRVRASCHTPHQCSYLSCVSTKRACTPDSV